VIDKIPVPEASLLHPYTLLTHGYTDCYVTSVAGQVQLPIYIAVFYCSAVFKLERIILRCLGLPSNDIEAAQLGSGERKTFAAWFVEARQDHQILLSDIRGNTRSWLMVEHRANETALFFGSAVVPRSAKDGTALPPAWIFRMLLGFHQLYSRVLLGIAARRLRRTNRSYS
jgi:hypothetical protein|tara:strand:- start:129 stop:641 length:513 start_codon:yes stop_codon:yes gene_type:complete